MSVANTDAAAAAATSAAQAATEQVGAQATTTDQASHDDAEQLASADVVIQLCADAGMSDQIANMVKAKLTKAGVESRIATISGVRDALAAANLSHTSSEVCANLDNPAAMLSIALTAATAHGDDKEVTSSKAVQTEATSVKQPDAKAAYNDPSRL